MELVPKSIFSWNFDVVDDNQSIANINLSSWREKGSIDIAGINYQICRKGLINGDIEMSCNGEILLTATKFSFLVDSYQARIGGRKFLVKKKGILSRKAVVLQDDNCVATIKPASFFTRKMTVEFSEQLSLKLYEKVFILWLVALIQKRESDSSGFSGG